jgi:hypothetical protein
MPKTSSTFDVEQWPVGAGSASIFVPVEATEVFSGTSEYARARAAAVVEYARRRNLAGGAYNAVAEADMDGYFLQYCNTAEEATRESWMMPLAYVHGGLPVSARSVRAGVGFNEYGVWERSSLARVVQHAPAPVVSVDGGVVLELPSGVMARRCLAYIASRVVESGAHEFAVPSSPRGLARAIGMPALSADGYRKVADVFRMCLGLSSVVFERAEDGSRGKIVHAFSVGADVSDRTMGVTFSVEGNREDFMMVRVSEAFCDYVMSGNVVAISAKLWEAKVVRSSAVALDVLAFISARRATAEQGGNGKPVWVSWTHLTRQFSVFSASVHKAHSVYRAAVKAVREAFSAAGEAGILSLVGFGRRKGFSGFAIKAASSAMKVVKQPKRIKRNATTSTDVVSRVSRAELNESAAKGEQVTVPAKAPRRGSMYRAVDLNLLSSRVSGVLGVNLPVISEEWERIIDTIVDRFHTSALNGNMKKVGNWNNYVFASIKNQPSLLDTPVEKMNVPRYPNSANTSRHATKPERVHVNVHTDNATTHQDTDFGTPSAIAVAAQHPNGFDLLTQKLDEDGICTLKFGTEEHHSYEEALSLGQVPTNTLHNWKNGTKFPPVRIQTNDGGYLYPNQSTPTSRGDEYFCRVLTCNDYTKEIRQTVQSFLAARNPNQTAQKELPSLPSKNNMQTVRVEGFVDGYPANFTVTQEDVEVEGLPSVTNQEEAQARFAILSWLKKRDTKEPLLGSLNNPKPTPTDEYPIMW